MTGYKVYIWIAENMEDAQILLLYYIFVMQKGNINFKEMRKKVIQPFDNSQNIPSNPLNKLSFRAIKKNSQKGRISSRIQTLPSEMTYRTDISNKILQSNRSNHSSKEDCNKFSQLLQSKGYSNSGSTNKDYPNSTKNINQLSFKSIQRGVRGKCDSVRERQEPQTDKIAQKCRQIKEKQYFSSRKNLHQLNSLSKLKGKLISPLKKKTVSQPEPKPEQGWIFEHDSILSEHDLVNMSKTSDTVDFDMSPCL